MPLFKYVRPERLDILENSRIGFSPPASFNDPFECLPSASLVDEPGWLKYLQARYFEKERAEEHIRAAIEKRPVRILRPSAPEMLVDEINRLRPGIKRVAMGTMDRHRNGFRICCLSAVAPEMLEGLLLWAHYTDQHKGFVIEFDSEHPWFENFASDSRGFVQYASQRCECRSEGVGPLLV